MSIVQIEKLMQTSGVKFGTSGARGLVADMTDRVCFAYVLAFLNYLEHQGLVTQGMQVAVAGDYRASSPRIMRAVGLAIQEAGFVPVLCGFVPTPALALYAIKRGMPSIMVTGSHIPDDRNGIKFYKPEGEILKDDELGMCSREVSVDDGLFDASGFVIDEFVWLHESKDAYAEFVQRYVDFFPKACLKGKRIGVYEHSSVAREVLVEIMGALGAEVICLGRSDQFIPVDTEAVREEDIILAKQWSGEYQLDCIVSADGDGDRPLVSDEFGVWLRGDVAGIICANYLQARCVATPVSCNSALEKSGFFERIERTRIGSPFVIEAMNILLAEGKMGVVGYEANGGFLTASDMIKNGRTLTALPTRDAVIVPLAILMDALEQGVTISKLLQRLPQRFTSSGRLQNFATALSEQRLAPLKTNDFQRNKTAAELLFGQVFGQVVAVNATDGVRITFESQEVIHLRPSGNAPELRCYVEAESESRAEQMLQTCLQGLKAWV